MINRNNKLDVEKVHKQNNHGNLFNNKTLKDIANKINATNKGKHNNYIDLEILLIKL